MDRVTTPAIQVELRNDTAQALWAAMFDDDSMVDDYVNVAVIHALNHLLAEVRCSAWPRERYEAIVAHLKQAREAATLGGDDLADRFSTYAEPPF